MPSMSSEIPRLAATVTTSVKIVVAGRFGVGKTTFIGSVSEITPLSTEAVMTDYGRGIDDLAGGTDKTTTTVAMDFGRRTLGDDIVLYLFGAPGQERFQGFVDDLMIGALGGIVLADTRDIEASFEHITRFEKTGTPFAVAVNTFPATPDYSDTELREALAVPADTPLVHCDARDTASAKHVLIALVGHIMTQHPAESR